jgi:uncharacterized protein (DUF1015 family)
MAKILPFKCIRPTKELAREVSSVPYDVVSASEARDLARNNPNSFLRIIRSEIDFDEEQNPYAEEVYQKARDNFLAALEGNVLFEDSEEAYYIYRISEGGHSQTGIVGLSSVSEYNAGLVKIHEKTRPEKEDDRVRHMQALGAQPGPVFLIYRTSAKIESLISKHQATEPLYHFTAEDNSEHIVWKLTDTKELQGLFTEVPTTYIADGHHRAKTASRVAAKKAALPSAQSFLSVLFSDEAVQILPYNRIIKQVTQSPAELIEQLEDNFEVSTNSEPTPSSTLSFSLYFDGTWHGIKPKGSCEIPDDPVDSLDISVLEQYVLKPIFRIEDQRTDPRIDFVGGSRGTAELERLVQSGKADVAISMYPVTVDQLIGVADSGRLMPPKSTWFAPKLRSGLFVYKFDQ